MITEELKSVILCPISKEKLTMADDVLLSNVQQKINEGNVKSRNGEPVNVAPNGLLVNESKTFAYPVHSGIPLLLPACALAL